MSKKDIIKDALISAREIELAAKNNAQQHIIEAFIPRLEDVIRQTLNEEGPGPQLDSPIDDLAKGEEEETESSEVQNAAGSSDGHPEKIEPTQGDKEITNKGKGHKLDKPAEKPAQENSDAEVPGSNGGNMNKKSMDGALKEAEDEEDEDVVTEELDDEELNDEESDDEELGLEEEESDDEELDLDDEELDLDDDSQSDDSQSDDSDDDDELEIPDELFDDPDEMEDKESSEDLKDEEVDPDEDQDMDDMMDHDVGEEELEDGLYVRRDGKFIKVDPAEALEDKMKDLEEEREKLASAVGFLKGQLGEVNLFNAKLAHLVKLYESGLFSRVEKKQIAERLDECTSIKGVKKTYSKIVKEASERTVLDSIGDVIRESRVRRNTKPTGESVYESAEVKRMRKLAGLDD